MNLLLLHPEDYTSTDIVELRGRRYQHMMSVQQIQVGDRLRAGDINGLIGTAEVLSVETASVTLQVSLTNQPPAPLPLTVIVSLPRPKMLKRIFQTLAAMGAKEIYVINAFRVDKSYWSTPLLSDASIQEHLLLGLEQAGDTLLPQVHLRKRFKPFVEDELPALAAGKRAFIAHPYDAMECPEASNEATLVAIGPEGGFIPYEVQLMVSKGLQAIHLGTRILRVETAVPALLSRLFPIL